MFGQRRALSAQTKFSETLKVGAYVRLMLGLALLYGFLDALYLLRREHSWVLLGVAADLRGAWGG